MSFIMILIHARSASRKAKLPNLSVLHHLWDSLHLTAPEGSSLAFNPESTSCFVFPRKPDSLGGVLAKPGGRD